MADQGRSLIDTLKQHDLIIDNIKFKPFLGFTINEVNFMIYGGFDHFDLSLFDGTHACYTSHSVSSIAFYSDHCYAYPPGEKYYYSGCYDEELHKFDIYCRQTFNKSGAGGKLLTENVLILFESGEYSLLYVLEHKLKTLEELHDCIENTLPEILNKQ